MLANKFMVIIGATGIGKTKLSIDVSKVIGGEVINADKMQIFAGLDITTYKVSIHDQCGIPHHLIGVVEYLNHRVHDMVDAGLVKELKDYFDASSNFVQQTRLGKAIGVKELGKYFMGHQSYCDAIAEMKDNTQALAKAWNAKIHHMVDVWGWPIFSLDATKTIWAHINGSDHMAEAKAWQRDVSGPTLNAISEFCNNFNGF